MMDGSSPIVIIPANSRARTRSIRLLRIITSNELLRPTGAHCNPQPEGLKESGWPVQHILTPPSRLPVWVGRALAGSESRGVWHVK